MLSIATALHWINKLLKTFKKMTMIEFLVATICRVGSTPNALNVCQKLPTKPCGAMQGFDEVQSVCSTTL